MVCMLNICVLCVFQAMMANMFHFCLIVIPMMFSLSVFNVITDSMLTKSVSPSDTGNPQIHMLDWTICPSEWIQYICIYICFPCKCFHNALNVKKLFVWCVQEPCWVCVRRCSLFYELLAQPLEDSSMRRMVCHPLDTSSVSLMLLSLAFF